MKKISLLAMLIAFVGLSFAQLPDGSYGENFTLYEIDKTAGTLITSNPISLYDYTNAGKSVIMDVSATWCGPCWSYHTSHALEDFYAAYGPTGTNQAQVLFVEGSDGNFASLSGTGPDAGGSATQGNWLAGVEYPVIPLRMDANQSSYNSFHSNYAIAYFPTVYLICPNRLVYETGQLNAAGLYNAMNTTCPAVDFSAANNALIISGSGVSAVYFCSATFTPSIKLQNAGTAALTSVDFNINCGGQTSTYTWTGNLAQYNVADITLPQMNVSNGGAQNFTVTITNVNGVADDDATMNSYSKEFNVFINGTTEPIDEDFSSCVSNNWSDVNGLLGCYNISAGSHGYALYFDCYSYSNGVQDELTMPMMNLSNTQNATLKFDVAHKRYQTSNDRLKVQYSTDCGATWTTAYNKAGADLTTGGATTNQFVPSTDSQWRTETVDLSGISNPENVIVKFVFVSNYGNVIWLDNVRVVDGTGVEEFDGNVTIYPNPATNVLNINSSESIDNVVIYNVAGQMVMSENGNVQSVNISNLAAGSYIARIQTADGNIFNQRFVKE